MAKDTMTPKERWLAVLKRQKPDRIPMDYWSTWETDKLLMKHQNCGSMDEVFQKLHIDKPVYLYAGYKGPAIKENEDMYGCKYRNITYGTGVYNECIYHPLEKYETVEEIEAEYRWPDIEWFDYSIIKDQVKGMENRPIQGGGSEPFLTYANLRGLEQAFMDLVLNPEIVDYCLDKLFGFSYENTSRIYEQAGGNVLLSYVAEDMGSEKDLMFSPDQVRRFLLPRMKRMIDLAHQSGVYVIHHNDGSIQKILPDMISAGIDVLNPIQWRCKDMDRESLKSKFGDKVIFHGGVDNQQTLPFGTADDVRKEVKDNIAILGRNGGYILAPCHNIQALTPPENIVALYEAGYEYGW